MGHYVGFGHSHIANITWAFEELEVLDPGRFLHTSVNFLLEPYRPEVSVTDGVSVLNPAWVATMQYELLDPEVVVFLCVCGSEWWRWSLTPGPRPFDFIDPLADDGRAPIGQLLPYDLFMRKARSGFHAIDFVADTIRRYTANPLVQFAPPPPARDMATLMAADPGYSSLVAEYGISPPYFRLKVWRACARAMGQVCAEGGIDFLMPPPEGLDEDGFLRQDLVDDPVHANTAFGRMQIEQLRAHIARRKKRM